MFKRCVRWLPLLLLTCFAVSVPLWGNDAGASFANALQPPSSVHLAGTDHYGHDLLTRTALGLRTSLAFGGVAALSATILGVLVGLTAAAAGGVVDRVLMRFADAVNALPHLVAGVAIVALLGGSPAALVASIALTHWTQVARVVRGVAVSTRSAEYVVGARLMGASRRWLMLGHLFPSVAGHAAVSTLMLVPHAVWHESTLSFLGLGFQPDSPSLGTLIEVSRSDIMVGAWWTLALPATALVAATLALFALRPLNPLGARQ